MVGQLAEAPMDPIVEERTVYVARGPLLIGVEPRQLYGRFATLAPADAAVPHDGLAPGVATDSGVTVHVLARGSGHEFLRFDLFERVPHYHYNRPPRPGRTSDNWIVLFDPVANGEMLPWVVTCLRTRLVSMLREAGGDTLAAGVAELSDVDRDELVAEVQGLVHGQQRASC